MEGSSYSLSEYFSTQKKEAVYKLNRDLTRESKKLICTLHQIPGSSADEKESILLSVLNDLLKLKENLINKILSSTKGDPLFLFSSVCSSGLEEYLEALQFFTFIKWSRVLSFSEVLSFLSSPQTCDEPNTTAIHRPCGPQSPTDCGAKKLCYSQCFGGCGPPSHGDGVGGCHAILSQDTHLLALGDVSGEIMRFFIKSCVVGDKDVCSASLSLMRQMKEGYEGLPPNFLSKSLVNKIDVHCKNLAKIENIEYEQALLLSDAKSIKV